MNWISTKERFPESSNTEVLAVCNNKIHAGFFADKNTIFSVSLYFTFDRSKKNNIEIEPIIFDISKVSHWMNLPEKPNK